MNINQVGRSRASALGQADFDRTAVGQKILLRNTSRELDNVLNKVKASIPQRLEAKQTVDSRIKGALLNTLACFFSDVSSWHIRAHREIQVRPQKQEIPTLAIPEIHVMSEQEVKAKKQDVPTLAIPEIHIMSEQEVKAKKKELLAQAAKVLPKNLDDFNTVWNNRHTQSDVYAFFLNYADFDQPEMPRFLREMDDFRASPTPEKAENLLYDFIMPAKIDDAGLPMEGAGKWQINFASDVARNSAIDSVKQSIQEARNDRVNSEKLLALVTSFAGTEKYVVAQLRLNSTFGTDLGKLMLKS